MTAKNSDLLSNIFLYIPVVLLAIQTLMITEAGLLHNLDYEISSRETCVKPLTPDQKIRALIKNHQAMENLPHL